MFVDSSSSLAGTVVNYLHNLLKFVLCIYYFQQNVWSLSSLAGIYEQFANAFSTAVQSMKVGDGFGEGVVQVGKCSLSD